MSWQRTLVKALSTHLAILARFRDELDADAVSDLHGRVDSMFADRHNLANTLVPADDWVLSLARVVVQPSVQVYAL
jgi:hypothetical protein